jgi:hypothetical protein
VLVADGGRLSLSLRDTRGGYAEEGGWDRGYALASGIRAEDKDAPEPR